MPTLRPVAALLTAASFAIFFAACSSKSSHAYVHIDNQGSNQANFVWGPSANDATPWNTFVDGKSPGNGPGRHLTIDPQASVKLDLPPAGHYRWGALELLPDPSDPTSIGWQLVQDSTFDSDGSSDVTLEINGHSTIDAGPPVQAACGKLSPPPPNNCTTAGYVPCNADKCCASDKPYWCNSKCYASAAAVAAAGCATECFACGNAPATTGTTPGGDAGSGDSTSGGLKPNGSVCLSPSECASGKCPHNICACDDAGHDTCPCLAAGASCGNDDAACCSLSCGINSTGFCD